MWGCKTIEGDRVQLWEEYLHIIYNWKVFCAYINIYILGLESIYNSINIEQFLEPVSTENGKYQRF